MGWDDMEGTFGICIIPLLQVNKNTSISILSIIPCISNNILGMGFSLRLCSLSRTRSLHLQHSFLFIKILDRLVACLRLLVLGLEEEVAAGLRAEVVTPIFIRG